MKSIRIAVAMACHNRKEKTLQCLDSLLGQSLPKGVNLSVFLTDDGSSDGTSPAVTARYPNVHLLKGDGTLYWNGAMYLALAEAARQNFDFHLWLNDDVILYENSLGCLLKTHGEVFKKIDKDAIIVGCFCDSLSGDRTYGGQRRASRWHPLRFEQVYSETAPLPCHTFQGNGVLVPTSVVNQIGIIDSCFSCYQEMGDTDYGLRATGKNIPIYASPGYIGECELNTEGVLWKNSHLSFGQRWAVFTGPKGIKANNYFTYSHRHGGRFWGVFWVVHMLKALPGLFFPNAKIGG